jgi:hypothetical protein
MKNICFVLCCASALVAAPAGAEIPGDFHFRIPLVTQNAEGLHRVEVPLAVYQTAARADLGDLRVFNGRGEKVPYAFAGGSKREIQKRETVALPFFPLYQQAREALPAQSGNIDLQIRQRPDGTLISLRSGGTKAQARGVPYAYLVDASRNKEYLRALQFDWNGHAGQIARLRIDSSEDLKSWQTLVASAPLLNLEFGGERLVQNRIEFAPAKPKYLRLTWDRDAFELRSLQAEIPDAEIQPVFGTLKIDGRAGDKPGDYVFDLGARVPVERLYLALPQPNTLAPAQVLSRGDAKSEWRWAGTTTFYRLTRDGIEVVSPPLSFAPRSDRYWLVRIEQKGGGLGSGTPQLEVNWMPRQIVFVARGEGPYALAYGRSGAGPASFAVSNLIPDYKPYAEFALPLAAAGTPSADAAVGNISLNEWLRETDGKRVTLWAMLLGGVALLAWMAWRLTRQMNAAPDGAAGDAHKPQD